jgi:pimeloyl-ACP methyl ester carboxylesterase
MWNDDFQALRATYKLILLDAFGFGRSPKPDIEYTVTDHLAAIHQTLQSLNVQTAHVVGHSMGSILALAYAHTYPKSVGKLALLALPCYRSEAEARERIKQSSLFNRLLAMDTPLARITCAIMCRLRPLFMAIAPMLAHDVPPVVAKDALRHTWASYSRTMQHIIFSAPAKDWLAEAPHPTLIIQGNADHIAPLGNVQQVIDHRPNITLRTIEAGHRLVFTHSALVAKHIADFLQDEH